MAVDGALCPVLGEPKINYTREYYSHKTRYSGPTSQACLPSLCTTPLLLTGPGEGVRRRQVACDSPFLQTIHEKHLYLCLGQRSERFGESLRIMLYKYLKKVNETKKLPVSGK